MNSKKMFGPRVTAAMVLSSMLLIGCSEESDPPPENQAPTITMGGTSLNVEEGKVLTVPFVIADPDGSAADLNVKFKTSPEQGSATVALDKSTGKGFVQYTANWITDGSKSLQDGFTLTVTDLLGAQADASASITVADVSSPATIKMTPPPGAYGYQNTQKDTLLNFWFNEGQELVLAFVVDDNDGDALDIDYSVTEGVVFNNQVQMAYNGNTVTAKIPVPNIDEPSTEFTFTLKVDDGDGVSAAEAHVTIVNKVGLRWTSTASTLKESLGGKITFASTENASYPGDYKVEVTLVDGSELPFDLPYSFDPVNGVLEFGAIPSPGIVGNQSVKATIALTNTLTHAGGESYKEISSLIATMSILDDRDDDFKLVLNDFDSFVDKVDQTFVREDERRLASVFGTYLLANGLSSKPDVDAMVSAVKSAFEADKAKIKAISAAVYEVSDTDTAKARELIGEYRVEVAKLGASSIETLNSQLQILESKFPSGTSLPLPKPNVNGSTLELAGVGALSRYIGDLRYGVFLDTNKTRWEFSPSYAYMNVVDYSTGDVCFL